MSFLMFQFFFAGPALFFFFVAAPGRLHPRVAACPFRTAAPSKILPRHAMPLPHRTGTPAVSPGQTQNLEPWLTCRQSVRAMILSAARIFALRDRGLRSISSSLAVTGFFVST